MRLNLELSSAVGKALQMDGLKTYKPKKVTSYKGFKIEQQPDGRFLLYTNDEWLFGKGFRYPEWDACTLQEAKEWIDCY